MNSDIQEAFSPHSPVIRVRSKRKRLPTLFISKTLNISLEAATLYHHPGTTEVEILDYVIHNYSSQNDYVIDPMCGVGTFIKRSLELGRNAFGYDTVDEYVKLANASVKELTGETHRIKRLSAFKLAQSTNWDIQFNLCFFSPPLLNITRGRYPASEHQIGNYGFGEEKLWVRDVKKVIKNVSTLLHHDGYLAINWKNQRANDVIIPLSYLGTIAAIDFGYQLIDEKLITFDKKASNRSPEQLHILKLRKNKQLAD